MNKAWKIARAGLDPAKDIELGDVIALAEYMALIGGMMTGTPTPYAVQVERAIVDKDPRQLMFSRYVMKEDMTAAEKAKAKREAIEQSFKDILSQNRYNKNYDDLLKNEKAIIDAEMR